jgi:phosphotransferase system enzyme I (PtsI)
MANRTHRADTASTPTQTKVSTTLTGRSLSPGLAVGKAYVYREDTHDRQLERRGLSPRSVDEELARVEAARSEVIKDLDETAKRIESEMSREHAEIFRSQADMLRASSLMDWIKEGLESEVLDAADSVRRVLSRLEARFGAAEDPVFQQRADDIADIARRLVLALAGTRRPTPAELPEGGVLVADRLLPSDTLMLSRRTTAAVVVDHGGPLSHAALLTREMGIPAVGQIPGLMDLIAPGARLLVDGSAGKVVLDPGEPQLQAFEERMREHRRLLLRARRRRHEPARTRDGALVRVWANIATREDAALASDSGAEGIGLYRIEGLYLPRQFPPTEQELLAGLRETLAPVRSKSITVRLLDIGADKTPVFLSLPAEPNPSLGRRGVRLLLDYPDLLSTQLRALLRLSREMDLRICVPMVTLLDEFRYLRRALEELGSRLGVGELPPLGAMIETPCAALCAREIAEAADFLSLGTNDLTQYTMVAGREEDSVTDYYLEDHPAVQRLMEMVMEAAGTTPVTLCGELAGRTDRLPGLLRMGLTSLSVAAPLVPMVKQAVRTITIETTRVYPPAARRDG